MPRQAACRWGAFALLEDPGGGRAAPTPEEEEGEETKAKTKRDPGGPMKSGIYGALWASRFIRFHNREEVLSTMVNIDRIVADRN